MATLVSKHVNGIRPITTSAAVGDDQAVVYEYAFTSAPALNDIVDLGILPANHTVSDMIIVSDDLDSNASPTIKFDVGIMSGTPGDAVSVRTCGTEFFAADASPQTGSISRMTQKSGFIVPAVGYDRSIGVKINTAAATFAAGSVRLRVNFVAALPPLI